VSANPYGTTGTARNRYVGDSVATASPARLVTMLYDRLVRDLLAGQAALERKDFSETSSQLIHAQDILWELLAGLDTTKWAGGPALASLYQFLIKELVSANMGKDVEKVASCRKLIEPLRDAWHQAADELGAQRNNVPLERITA
jgi:flagellar protein FliS